MLTTFWTDSFRDRDSYMIRFLIPNDIFITSLILCQAKSGLTTCRYSLILLPHRHDGGRIWNRQPNAVNWQFHECPITCGETSAPTSCHDVTCILWNSLGASLTTVVQVVQDLLLEDNPQILIITEPSIQHNEVSILSQCSPFTSRSLQDTEDGFPRMLLLWRPSMVTVTEHPTFPQSIHVMIQGRHFRYGERVRWFQVFFSALEASIADKLQHWKLLKLNVLN